MEEPWLHSAVFSAIPVDGTPPQGTADEIEKIFKSPELYQKFLTCRLYDHVPSKFHGLITGLSKFADNGRPAERLSTYFHPNLNKTTQTRLLNPVLPMALRCLLFGAASISKGAKPLTTTYGHIWKVKGHTVGSISFTLIIIHVLSGVDTNFDQKGKISKIPFLTYFRTYKKLLLKHAATPGIHNILRFWSEILPMLQCQRTMTMTLSEFPSRKLLTEMLIYRLEWGAHRELVEDAVVGVDVRGEWQVSTLREINKDVGVVGVVGMGWWTWMRKNSRLCNLLHVAVSCQQTESLIVKKKLNQRYWNHVAIPATAPRV
ncbi:hypothetical protein C8R45DRAFT_1099304 [Mycena sanguinolenta]|nr:hypothetical protein C8R45DRAFT_1099304 [Mycena sanguinolenta]